MRYVLCRYENSDGRQLGTTKQLNCWMSHWNGKTIQIRTILSAIFDFRCTVHVGVRKRMKTIPSISHWKQIYYVPKFMLMPGNDPFEIVMKISQFIHIHEELFQNILEIRRFEFFSDNPKIWAKRPASRYGAFSTTKSIVFPLFLVSSFDN